MILYDGIFVEDEEVRRLYRSNEQLCWGILKWVWPELVLGILAFLRFCVRLFLK